MLTAVQMEQNYQATRKRRLTPEEMEAQYQASLGGQQAEPAPTVDIQPVSEPMLPTQSPTGKPIPQLRQGPIDPMTQYAHRRNYLIQQADEEAPLVQPWVDPIDAATAGFGAGAKIATSAGKPILSALARGAAAAIPAAATDIPIGMLAEQAEQSEGGALALLTALGAGVLSGTTIEPAMERAIYNTASRAAMRFRRSPKIVAMAKKLGIDPEAQIANRMREHNAGQVAQAQAAGQPPTYQRPGVPETPPPQRMDAGIAEAMAAAEGIPRGGRIAPVRTIQETVTPPPPTRSPVTGQPYRVAGQVDEGQVAAEIAARAQEGAPAERAAEAANKRFFREAYPQPSGKSARLSADVMEDAYQRSLRDQAQARQANQMPQAGEALRRRLADEEAAGEQHVIENARRFTEEQPDAVRMAQNLINAPQISKEAQEQAVRRSKIDEIEQRTRRPIADMEPPQLLREASAFKHAGRDDLAGLLTEEIRYRQAKANMERKATAAPKGETLRWRLQQMRKGGVDVLNFEGEARDIPPMVRRNVLRRGGEPIDTAEETLRNEGWLHADEELLDVLRDPKALRRRNLHTDIGDRTRNLTDQEARLKSEMEHEEEMPPGFEKVPEDLQAKVASGEMTVDEALEKPVKKAGEFTLFVHPSTITGPAGGIAGGVDWEAYEKDGTIKIDPKRALVGALAGAAGPVAWRRAKGLGDAIANQWDKHLADPLLNWAKRRANGMIVNEEIRHALGMNRSEKLKDYLRDYNREIERVSNKAVELGKKLHKLAPTKAEQRRLYQIVRGGVTMDPKKREAAAEFRKLFDELRDQLKEADLLQYSRFDGLTRKERAKLRKIIARGPGGKPVTEEQFFSQEEIDPDILKAGSGWSDEYDVTGKQPNVGRTADKNAKQSKWSNQELADLYRMTGPEQKVALRDMGLTYPEFQKIYMAQIRSKGEVPEKWREVAPEWASEKIPVEAYEREKSPVEWAREKLHDYYHYGSAQEYAPIYYKEHEGLSPAERKGIEDEIKGLKKQSRYMNPEGDPVLENQIAGLEKLLAKGKKGRAELRKARTKLNKGYAHRRLDIPGDVQKMLGQIDEAAFAGAKGAFVQRTDLLKDRLFKQVLDNPEWAIPTRIKDPRTGEVTVKKVEPPENFVMVQSEDGEKYGALEGAYVRRDVWDDLREVEEWRGSFIRNWDKMMGAWKYGKVVLNPATHARNTMSNMILAYMGGVNPADAKTYGKAALAVAAGENDAGEVGRLRKLFKKVSPEQAKKYYQEAADWGLFNDTFVNTEITKLRDELEGLRDSAPKKFLRRAFQIPAEMYQGNEKLFKTALFIKQREAGKSIDEAARHAEKFLFNYADIPPWVKHMKRWVAPFFTFTYKAVPLFGEMAIRKPWKLAALGGAIYGLEEFSKNRLGMSDEEATTERRRLPEWQKKRTLGLGPYHHVLMPFKDKWGNNLYWDLSYILPYGNLGEDWGQSKIPLSDLLPSSPAFTMTAALLTNTDPFTGRDIYNKVLDSNLKIAAKYADLAWKQVTPSLAPGGYGFNKLKTGIENTFFDKDVKDWADRPIELQTAMASTLFGIKLSPANTRKLREFEAMEIKRIKKEVSIEKGRVRGSLRKGKITKKEAEEEFKKLNELNRKLIMEKLGNED